MTTPMQAQFEQLEAMTSELGLNVVLLRLAEMCDCRANELTDDADRKAAASWWKAAEIITEAADRLLEEGGGE